jgi:ferrous iron transport protein A
MSPAGRFYRWLTKHHGGARRKHAKRPPSFERDSFEGLARVSLADLRTSERGVVAALGGGRSVLQRLASMGFTPGATVEVVQNYGWGPLIVTTRGSRVALGRGEARHVAVEREAL